MNTPRKRQKKSRIVLDVGQSVAVRLEELRVATGATSIGESVRRALSLYDLAMKVEAEGGEIFFCDKGGSSTRIVLL